MPWELLDKPVAWMDIALMSLGAENKAQEQQEKRRFRRSKRR